MKKLVCQRCGAEFGCNADDIANCFCSKINLALEKIAELEKQYSNCLCPTCLEELAEEV